MTEREWLTASDPTAMLGELAGRVSDRKLRLFAAACSRRIWDRIDVLGQAAVEVAEAFADGRAGPEELRAARLACRAAGESAAWYAAASSPAVAARNAALSARAALGESEAAVQAGLLRDVVGPIPFRAVRLDPAFRTTEVVAIAGRVYESREFGEMPSLANGLGRAGCTSDEFLAHCRSATGHVRGCWVLDLVLGLDGA
jgi:hypothetical protein